MLSKFRALRLLSSMLLVVPHGFILTKTPFSFDTVGLLANVLLLTVYLIVKPEQNLMT